MNSNSKPKFFDNMFSVFLDKLNMSSIFWPCGHNKKKIMLKLEMEIIKQEQAEQLLGLITLEKQI